MSDAVKLEELRNTLEQVGFECIGSVKAADLVVREDVRAMCSSATCQNYGTNWACPPNNESLDYYRDLLGTCSEGYVFQTVAQLDDEFDGDTLDKLIKTHTDRLLKLVDTLYDAHAYPQSCVVLGAGTCSRCASCAYPEPCRFPDKRIVSMEAAGLMITEACAAAGIPYNHGKLGMAFSSCVLLRQGETQ